MQDFLAYLNLEINLLTGVDIYKILVQKDIFIGVKVNTISFDSINIKIVISKMDLVCKIRWRSIFGYYFLYKFSVFNQHLNYIENTWNIFVERYFMARVYASKYLESIANLILLTRSSLAKYWRRKNCSS
jgi:hypothetical protein